MTTADAEVRPLYAMLAELQRESEEFAKRLDDYDERWRAYEEGEAIRDACIKKYGLECVQMCDWYRSVRAVRFGWCRAVRARKKSAKRAIRKEYHRLVAEGEFDWARPKRLARRANAR